VVETRRLGLVAGSRSYPGMYACVKERKRERERERERERIQNSTEAAEEGSQPLSIHLERL
jgi:hypothetical protein